MDQKAKALDVKYQSIADVEAKVIFHQEAVKMLRNSKTTTPAVMAHIEKHEKLVKELQAEVEGLRTEQLEDFMCVENLDQLRILNMRYLENLNWEQIAELTGCTKRWGMLIRDQALSRIAAQKEHSKSSPQFTSSSLENSGVRR